MEEGKEVVEGAEKQKGVTKTIAGCKRGINLKGAERVWKW